MIQFLIYILFYFILFYFAVACSFLLAVTPGAVAVCLCQPDGLGFVPRTEVQISKPYVQNRLYYSKAALTKNSTLCFLKRTLGFSEDTGCICFDY